MHGSVHLEMLIPNDDIDDVNDGECGFQMFSAGNGDVIANADPNSLWQTGLINHCKPNAINAMIGYIVLMC